MVEIKEGQGVAGEPVKDLHKPSIMAGRFLYTPHIFMGLYGAYRLTDTLKNSEGRDRW